MVTTTRGRIRLLVGGAVVNLSLGSLFAWSLLVDPLAAGLGTPPSALASVFSVAVVMFAAVVLAGGRVVDRTPPRRIVVAGAVAALAGLLLAARADSLVGVIAGYGVLFGTANGLGYAVAVAVAGKAFVRRRGVALGVVVGAYAAGPLVASPVITALLARAGWRGALAGLGVGVCGALLAGAALLGSGAGGDLAEEDGAADHGPPRPLLLRPPGFALWLAFLLGTLPALLVVAHAAAIASVGGLGATAVSAAVAILGAGNLAGRTAGGWLSDRVGRLPGLRTATATLAVACVVLPALSAAWAILSVMAVVGIAYGTQSSLVPALTADLFGTAEFGANFGRIFTGWGVAGLLGPQVGAMLGGPDTGFATALWIGALSALAAFGLHLGLGRLGGAPAAGG